MVFTKKFNSLPNFDFQKTTEYEFSISILIKVYLLFLLILFLQQPISIKRLLPVRN